jgi:hypothetical protein
MHHCMLLYKIHHDFIIVTNTLRLKGFAAATAVLCSRQFDYSNFNTI